MTSDHVAEAIAEVNSRYFRWLFALILCLTFVPIPIYIYVFELHSSNLARIEADIATVKASLDYHQRWHPGRAIAPTH